ncbi:MAG: DUF1080 domain-containing protein [Verrucomicrobia bacterium]|nr:DUF1080 domain-containing protein [Verrucomicrobiota bacterium]
MKSPLPLRVAILTTAAAAAVVFTAALPAGGGADEPGFVPMFNGRDLSGWVPVNVAPETFTVKNGLIHCTGIPTGTMRTERMYENFIIELEWRHMKPGGNSGLFLWGDPISAAGTPFSRGIEVQILDTGYGEGNAARNVSFTTHGDIFPIHGAKMTPLGRVSKGGRAFPTEDRTKPSPEWNHYRVVATNGTVSLSVNGKEVSTSRDCIPRKGYLCLESEGSEIHFRNVRIKELPASNATPEQTARAYDGFVSLYTGVDLRNFKADPGHAGHWTPRDWTLNYDGKSEAADKNLWSEKPLRDFALVVDWRPSKPLTGVPLPVILPGGDDALDADKLRAALGPRLDARKSGQWHRFQITRKGSALSVTLDGQALVENLPVKSAPSGPFALRHDGAAAQFASVFVKELK